MMRTIVLHDEMAERFAPSYRMDVATLSEATRALGSQIDGFRQYIHDGHFHIFTLHKGDIVELDEEVIELRLGSADIHIMPVIEGAKRGAGIGSGAVNNPNRASPCR